MSYYGKRISSHKSRFREQKKERFLRVSGLVTLLLLLILIGLIYLSRLDKFQINHITIEGNSVTSSINIEEIIDNNISGFYFKMFPKKNFLIYPRRRIESTLQEEFRRILTLNISVSDFKNLDITLTERKPDSLWCGAKPNETKSGLSSPKVICYFVDYEGLIYSKAPNFTGNVFLRNYGEIENPSDPVGQNFLLASKYKSTRLITDALNKYDFKPFASTKLSAGDMEVYFENGGSLLYNLDQDIVKLVNDLDSVMKDEVVISDLAEKDLDYIDLRFNNKVYINFK